MIEKIENRIKELNFQLKVLNRSSLDNDLSKEEKILCEETAMKVLFAIEELEKLLK